IEAGRHAQVLTTRGLAVIAVALWRFEIAGQGIVVAAEVDGEACTAALQHEGAEIEIAMACRVVAAFDRDPGRAGIVPRTAQRRDLDMAETGAGGSARVARGLHARVVPQDIEYAWMCAGKRPVVGGINRTIEAARQPEQLRAALVLLPGIAEIEKATGRPGHVHAEQARIREAGRPRECAWTLHPFDAADQEACVLCRVGPVG